MKTEPVSYFFITARDHTSVVTLKTLRDIGRFSFTQALEATKRLTLFHRLLGLDAHPASLMSTQTHTRPSYKMSLDFVTRTAYGFPWSSTCSCSLYANYKRFLRTFSTQYTCPLCFHPLKGRGITSATAGYGRKGVVEGLES